MQPVIVIPTDEAKRAIAESESVSHLKGIRDYAEALRAYIRQRSGSLEEQNRAAEIKLRAERRAGEILADAPREGGRRRDLTSSQIGTRLQEALAEAEIGRSVADRWMTEASVTEAQFERWLEKVREEGEEITSAGLLLLAKGKDLESIFSSETAEWYTPEPYLVAARELLGGIDLDPASCEAANAVVGAAHYFTAEDDGLALGWAGRVFVNPPYGKRDGESNQGLWSKKLIGHYRAREVDAAVLLVNAVPSEQWFRPLWDFPICFTDHRIQFVSSNGKESGGTHSNAFVYLGPNLAEFIRLFSPFGVVAGRLDSGDAGSASPDHLPGSAGRPGWTQIAIEDLIDA